MAVAVTMPQMGESMVEGTVARWLKAPGETVAKFEALVEINTDKIDTEIPAPAGNVNRGGSRCWADRACGNRVGLYRRTRRAPCSGGSNSGTTR